MVNISVEVDDEKLNRALTRLAGVYADPRPAFRPMAERVVLAAREQINSAGRRSGRPWAPRAASTLKAITSGNRQGFRSVGLPGHATGRMFRGVGTLGGPDSIYREERDGVTIGTSLKSSRGFPYPVAFHAGTSRQPARPIYDLTDRDIREIVAVGKRSFRERVESLGFDYSDSSEAAF